MYLVEAKDAEVSYNGDGAQTPSGRDLAGHLKTDLDNLQRVCEQHLTSSGLQQFHTPITQSDSQHPQPILAAKCRQFSVS